jgi:hypothetical protein
MSGAYMPTPTNRRRRRTMEKIAATVNGDGAQR